MKKIFLIVFALIALYGCGGGDKKTEKKGSGADESSYEQVETSPDDKFSLQYKMDKGDKFSYSFTSISTKNETLTIDTTISITVRQKITYEIDIEVMAKKDTITNLRAVIKSAAVELNENDKKLTYKTGKKLNPMEKQFFMNYEAIVNSPFNMELSPTGLVLKVTGLNKAVDKMLTENNLQDSVTAEQKKMIEEDLTQNAIMPMTQHLFRLIPSQPVALNEPWYFSFPSNLVMFQINNKAAFKVIGKEKLDDDDIAKIDASLSMTWTGKTDFDDQGIKYHFSKPEVTGSGIIRYNLSKGLVQNSKTTTQFKLKAEMTSTLPQDKDKTANKVTTFTTENSITLL
ncbi:MAG: DUF6263 family protein [bacterium]